MEAALIYDLLLEEIALDLVFELHYAIKTGKLTHELLFDVPVLPLISTIDSKQNSKSFNVVVQCPNCQFAIGASRFAPHLEKCLSGTRRGAKKPTNSTNNNSATSISSKREFFEDSLPRKVKAKVEFVDPHPDSLIVRVKLVYGQVPSKPQHRCGATSDDFEAIRVTSMA